MRSRYLLLAGSGGPEWRDRLRRLGRRIGLAPSFEAPSLAAFVSGDCRCVAVGKRGCVVGTLFHRHGRAAALDALDDADSAEIAASGGNRLLSGWWGGYVAAIEAGSSVRVLRDPSATLPCYFTTRRGYAAFASDAELLVEAGLVAVDFDWQALARHFYISGLPTPETAMRGVSELLAGHALNVPGLAETQEPCWSPWDHVRCERGGFGEAAERLARTVKHSVRAWSSAHGRLLVSVSGGLDSSIVAACLAVANADAVCLTMYGEDPSGDERPFARALCNSLGLPLIERSYRIEDVDLEAPLGAHLPRPSDRTHALAYERVHVEAALETGASAFVTGNGGDSVFGYSQSAAAAADRWLSEGLGSGILATLRDICVQTGCGMLEAAASAARIARRPVAYRVRPDTLFLHPELVAVLERTGLDHAWLEPPADALPGKAAHIASILRIQQCLEPGRARMLPVLNPLMSQPVIEACLSVPTWEWRSGGRDRALARRAFAGDLPGPVLDRRVKGGPDGFAAQVLDAYRDAIRERLLGGRLAARRIVDAQALEAALDDPRTGAGESRARILELVAAEAWLDSWASRPTPAGPPPDLSARPAEESTS